MGLDLGASLDSRLPVRSTSVRLKSVIGISGHEGKPHPKGLVGLSKGGGGEETGWQADLGLEAGDGKERRERKPREADQPLE